MSEKKKSTQSAGKRMINTGGGAYIEGQVDINSGNFVGRDQYAAGLSPADVKQLFEPIYSQIESRPHIRPEDRADLKTEVEEIQNEVSKGAEADQTFLARRLRNIGRIAPDILEVVVATLTHPAAGFATVVKKVAEKAKASAS
jgi:hypothetical protein